MGGSDQVDHDLARMTPVAEPLAVASGKGLVAALTFDDGPNPGETERLLDVLGAHGVVATFCVVGDAIRAPRGAEVLRRIAGEGHTLCNHATSWADMGDWPPERVADDLFATLAIIRDVLGDPAAPVPFFRAPNGNWGVSAHVAVMLGMQPLGLGNTIADWRDEWQDEVVLAGNLRAAIQPGAVVLVHDGGGERSASVAAVASVLPEYLAAGWRFTLPVIGG